MTIDLLRSYSVQHLAAEEDVLEIRRFYKSMDTDEIPGVQFREFLPWYLNIIQHYRYVTFDGSNDAPERALTEKARAETSKREGAAGHGNMHRVGNMPQEPYHPDNEQRFKRGMTNSTKLSSRYPADDNVKITNPYCI